MASRMTPPPNRNHVRCSESESSHPDNPVPEEPSITYPKQLLSVRTQPSASSSVNSFALNSSDSEVPSSPATDISDGVAIPVHKPDTIGGPLASSLPSRPSSAPPRVDSSRRENPLVRVGAETKEVEKACCGGGCCIAQDLSEVTDLKNSTPVQIPNNLAYRSLNVSLGCLGIDTALSKIADPPEQTVFFEQSIQSSSSKYSTANRHPPSFVTPHPPYEVFSAKVHHARELTKPGAEKRTYHFDIDVTDYPRESGEVDFIVGGAIGVQAPNSTEVVEETLDLLGIPRHIRDRSVIVKTTKGRWPTIWGDDEPRSLHTTRRELLTWCSDLQSYPPTKQLFRLLHDHASEPNERQILLYLCSAQGQAAFCDLRTDRHITIPQLLTAFPSSQPPLPHLLSILQPLMPRFYSLSQDPQLSHSKTTDGTAQSTSRRLVEIAVTVHGSPHYTGGHRTGVGSGFLERIAHQIIEAEQKGLDPRALDLRIPMFRGLMANPLAKEFVTDGPMLLIGAGVGVAPFRGFVQRRLKSANCANKVWVLQGIRDSLLDELYSGEWGVEEEQVKKVVESRRGEGRYVQEEVRHQADLVWYVINSLDGRVFVCGSGKGMGEGVESALIDVVMDKGGVRREEAEAFWEGKKTAGQYIAVSHLEVLFLQWLTSVRKHGEKGCKSFCIPCTKSQALHITLDTGLDGLGITFRLYVCFTRS